MTIRRSWSPLFVLSLLAVQLLPSCSSSSKGSGATPSRTLSGSATAGPLVQKVTPVTHYTFTIVVPGETTITLLDAKNTSLGVISVFTDASGDALESFVGADGNTASITTTIASQAGGGSLARRIYAAGSEQVELDVLTNGSTTKQLALASPDGGGSSSGSGITPSAGFTNVLEIGDGAPSVSSSDIQAWLKNAVPGMIGNAAVITVDAVTLDTSLLIALNDAVAGGSSPSTKAEGELRLLGGGDSSSCSAGADLSKALSSDACGNCQGAVEVQAAKDVVSGGAGLVWQLAQTMWNGLTFNAGKCAACLDGIADAWQDYDDCVSPPMPSPVTPLGSGTGSAQGSGSGSPSGSGSSSSSSSSSSGSGSGSNPCEDSSNFVHSYKLTTGSGINLACAQSVALMAPAGFTPGECPTGVGCCVNQGPCGSSAECYYMVPGEPANTIQMEMAMCTGTWQSGPP